MWTRSCFNNIIIFILFFRPFFEKLKLSRIQRKCRKSNFLNITLAFFFPSAKSRIRLILFFNFFLKFNIFLFEKFVLNNLLSAWSYFWIPFKYSVKKIRKVPLQLIMRNFKHLFFFIKHRYLFERQNFIILCYPGCSTE